MPKRSEASNAKDRSTPSSPMSANHRFEPEAEGRLFALRPEGLSTGLVESITSYIARLSILHDLPTWAVTVRELAPFFQKRSLIDDRGHCDLFAHVGASLNGLSQTSVEATQLLSWRTKIKGLERLTLSPLSHVLSPRSTIKCQAAWCPHCFDNWHSTGETIYEPLVWFVKPIRNCPVHGVPLVETCHSCGKSHFPLERYSRPGFCPRCQEWLGTKQDGACPPPIQAGNITAASETLNLLEASSESGFRPFLNLFKGNVQNAKRSLFGGSAAAFARAAGIHHSSLLDLINAGARPGLDTLLRLSSVCNRHPADMLTGSVRFTQSNCNGFEAPLGPAKITIGQQWEGC